MNNQLYYIHGIPQNANDGEIRKLRSRLIRDVEKFIQQTEVDKLSITISTDMKNEQHGELTAEQNRRSENSEISFENRALRYASQQPSYKFSHLEIAEHVHDDLITAIDAISIESIVFDSWGLRDIQPNPRTILNFYGPPGTGKTLAAHAIADYLDKPILLVSYADIESKFHGDGPKNLKSIFYAAERDKAVLFIDEADSLLSKRLTSINTGSEQAINSMRSELLICLEKFEGIVIFATNLVESYDAAFETRIRHLHFPMPDFDTRLRIWKRHLPEKLPLSQDTSLSLLAEIDDVCGRDIREAVIDAANRAALRAKRQGKSPEHGLITQPDLIAALLRRKDKRIQEPNMTPISARGAGSYCYDAAPSEPSVRLTTHSAQSNYEPLTVPE